MNDVYSRLEFDKILEQISSHSSFSLGKEAVLNHQPIDSELALRRELERLNDAMHMLRQEHDLSFLGITDVSFSLRRAEKQGVLSIEEIVAISRFMQGTARLKKSFKNLEEAYPSLDDLFESLDFDESVLEYLKNSFGEDEVLDRASSELREVRRAIKRVEKAIDEESQKFLKTHAHMLSEQVISYQNGRRTFLMKPSDKNKIPGIVYGESASGQSVYFEPQFLSNMHNELHGLKIREEEEVARICMEASLKIGRESPQLLANLETLTLLDVIFAKAHWGVRREATVPSIHPDGFYLENARHPLIGDDEVVPNTYRLMPPHHTILISGPNTGGKSVSLKTMGIAALSLQNACPILADKAEVMLVDEVFVDIGDQQSIEKSLSSFSAHLETIKYISENASDRSLILLDELGSQTDPLEGESLAMAILDYFRDLGAWIVATTHFSRLKNYGAQHQDILIASLEFNLKNLQPTYRYRENVSGDSNALAIATRMGVSSAILDAAFRYKQEGQYEEDRLLDILESKIEEQEELKEQLLEQEKAMKNLFAEKEKEYEALQKELEEKEKQLITEYNAKIDAALAKARKHMTYLNQTHRPDKRKEAVKEIEKMKETVKQPMKPATIEVGDKVKITSTNQVGTVENVEGKEAKVQVGILSISVPIDRLEKINVPKKKKVQTSHRVKRVGPRVSMECNVIGKRVAEAIPIVDKYLDDAILQGLTQVRIIHGHGTGQLRMAIHQHLRKHKHVDTFELASVSQGGAGATVVKLK